MAGLTRLQVDGNDVCDDHGDNDVGDDHGDHDVCDDHGDHDVGDDLTIKTTR